MYIYTPCVHTYVQCMYKHVQVLNVHMYICTNKYEWMCTYIIYTSMQEHDMPKYEICLGKLVLRNMQTKLGLYWVFLFSQWSCPSHTNYQKLTLKPFGALKPSVFIVNK